MGHRGLRRLAGTKIVIALIAYFLSVTAVKSLRIGKWIPLHTKDLDKS